MKKVMAVYDTDPFYAERFADFINRREKIPMAVMAFTSMERLKKYGYAGFEREWGSYAREAADINITSCSLIRKGRKK